MTARIRATPVDDIDDAHGTPGAFEIIEHADSSSAGVGFICPCGCGREGYLSFTPPGPQWTWDGNREAPTLTPSVQQVGGCRWHGWLRAGEWVTC
jgi:hypothetical protein